MCVKEKQRQNYLRRLRRKPIKNDAINFVFETQKREIVNTGKQSIPTFSRRITHIQSRTAHTSHQCHGKSQWDTPPDRNGRRRPRGSPDTGPWQDRCTRHTAHGTADTGYRHQRTCYADTRAHTAPSQRPAHSRRAHSQTARGRCSRAVRLSTVPSRRNTRHSC